MFKNLIKAAISTALLNKAVRGVIMDRLVNLIYWVMQPSMRSNISAFATNLLRVNQSSQWQKYFRIVLKAVLALTLLRFTKKSWIIRSLGISTIGAILLTLIRLKEGHRVLGRHGQKDQIIDVDGYTVVDEKP